MTMTTQHDNIIKHLRTAKGFFNTMDVKFFEDGSYEYDF